MRILLALALLLINLVPGHDDTVYLGPRTSGKQEGQCLVTITAAKMLNVKALQLSIKGRFDQGEFQIGGHDMGPLPVTLQKGKKIHVLLLFHARKQGVHHATIDLICADGNICQQTKIQGEAL
jgi:hypothetical protein